MMPTKVIYLGEPSPPPAAVPPALPPLAPGDTGWPHAPVIQMTHPTSPVPPVQGGHGTVVVPQAALPPVTAPYPATQIAPTQPMLLVYPPPAPQPGSRGGSALIWLALTLGLISLAVIVVVRVAPDRAAQIGAQLRRAPARVAVARATDTPRPSAQNALMRISVASVSADQLMIAVVNVSDHPFALAPDAVQLRADDVEYVMPSGVPTVELAPGDEHQIVIRPVPSGTTLVIRIHVPGADAVELPVR